MNVTGTWTGPVFGDLGKLCRENGKVQCHLCGRFYRGVSFHVKLHGVLMDEYREIAGLNRITAAISDDIRLQRSKHGTELWYGGKIPIADPEHRKAVQAKLNEPGVRAANTINNPRRLESALNPPPYPEWAKEQLAARNRTEESRRNTSLRQTGRKLSEGCKAHISDSVKEFYRDRPGTRLGQANSPETRAKQSASRKALFASGYVQKKRSPLSEESRSKISQTLKAKYSSGMTNYQKGKPLTEGHKEKIKASLVKTRRKQMGEALPC